MANIGIPLLALEPMTTWCRLKQYYIWKKANEMGHGMADKKFTEAVLKSHNEYRSRHQVKSLSLSKDLSEAAQKWADHLAMTNSFEHSNASLKGEKLGENIAMKWSSRPDSYSGQEVTDQWYNEVKQYTFGSGSGSSGTGHFSQVVWKGSKELGVGKAQTRDGKIIVVAQYRPAGNMIGDHAMNVLPPKDGKIIIRAKPAEQTNGGQHVVTHESRGGEFKSRFDDMRMNAFPSDSPSGGRFTSESRSVRTYTVTEGVGSNKVTKTITEETIIKPNGDKIVNKTEKITSGSGGGGAAIGGSFSRDLDDKCHVSRSPLKDSSSKSSSSSREMKPEKMSDFIDGVVKAHNKVREKHGVSKLKHSKDLSAHAQKWAEQLASSGTFEHSQCTLKGERIGENIACKWSSGGGAYTSQEVSDQWYSEIAKHDFKSERSLGTGHFTQMMWKGSKELGVGKANDQSGKVIVVANYRPAGNMIGDYRENVFPLKK